MFAALVFAACLDSGFTATPTVIITPSADVPARELAWRQYPDGTWSRIMYICDAEEPPSTILPLCAPDGNWLLRDLSIQKLIELDPCTEYILGLRSIAADGTPGPWVESGPWTTPEYWSCSSAGCTPCLGP